MLLLGLLWLFACAVATAENGTPASGTQPSTRIAVDADEQRQPTWTSPAVTATTPGASPPQPSSPDAAPATTSVAPTLASGSSAATPGAGSTRAAYRAPPHPHYHLHSAGDERRHGPYFEDGPGPHNVTARVGHTVLLDCRIGLLQGKTVSWLHRRHDALQLLTVGRQEYSADQRVTLSFRYPGNWRLRIEYVRLRDQGLYECQVATHPPRVLRIYLTVTAPEVNVTDDKGHLVSERYYKAGSAVELTCVATHLQGPQEAVVWRHGDATLTTGVSTNVSDEQDSMVSTLTIERAQKRHSGNYTCAAGGAASTTVAVHVLNGQLPAAVQHNGSGSRPASGAAACLLLLLLLPVVMALPPTSPGR
ncbi:V-set and transmembrane domain-containing protein 2B-like [Schistocerca gregaria]|uniref:V-set and transmembrane domain-containing protein 2B-like n=1 Tax=Schistocerca gregaria TaxID=7010 RepID=UPI00211DAEF2|nr:V-set and transmembrane domain-containing protein 2B-like [Schistocerca gregaria]